VCCHNRRAQLRLHASVRVNTGTLTPARGSRAPMVLAHQRGSHGLPERGLVALTESTACHRALLDGPSFAVGMSSARAVHVARLPCADQCHARCQARDLSCAAHLKFHFRSRYKSPCLTTTPCSGCSDMNSCATRLRGWMRLPQVTRRSPSKAGQSTKSYTERMHTESRNRIQ
jgi:hypothetical protein